MSSAPPRRHWRSYGNDPLPTGAEAVVLPFGLRIAPARKGTAIWNEKFEA